MEVNISAVISTYNRAWFLSGLLKSISEQSLSKSRFEVIIINNNSTDNTEELSKEFISKHPDINVKYFIETQQGLSFGRNRGVAESSMKLVTFLDDDCVLTPDYLEQNISFFEKHPDAIAGGGKIFLNFLSGKPKWYNPFMARLLGYTYLGKRDKRLKTRYFSGSNMTFKREVFDRYGGFDSSLGRKGQDLIGSEEIEFFYRLRKGGEEMWYIASAIVYHQIPEERTRLSFVKKQALGIGRSQKQGALLRSRKHLLIARAKELAKWGVTLVLFLFYLISFRPHIALCLVKFRFWVSTGIYSDNS